jgi:NOL1/NOP2/sun family putative RNA methylase
LKVPHSLIRSLEKLEGFSEEAFIQTHALEEKITSIRVNPAKRPKVLPAHSSVPWAADGYYLETRPSFTFDPSYHAGCYYVQEASSMFLEQAVLQTVETTAPLKVLDLCAAPGGKSTHLQSLLHKSSTVVSNEVIRSRVNMLKDNLIRWGGGNVILTNNDPRDFARLKGFFDLIVVDAPCSGSGLIRREPSAADEWSEENVILCSQRQKRIVSDIWPCLKEGGIFIYSTCSYSQEEDEDIVQWMQEELGAEYLSLKVDKDWQIDETALGYRFWPDRVKGEGFFLAVMRKTTYEENVDMRVRPLQQQVSANEKAIASTWIETANLHLVRNGQNLYAWPLENKELFHLLFNELRVVLAGVAVGQFTKEKLIPSHALALSQALLPERPFIELNRDQAIRYLQKKELQLEDIPNGWTLATWEGFGLGWMNVLKNRINNYFPTELRIRKETEDSK